MGVLGGALILGEAVPLTDVLGMIVIGTGILLVALAHRTQPGSSMPDDDGLAYRVESQALHT